MITRDNIKQVLISEKFGFFARHGVFSKHFGSADEGFDLEYHFETGDFLYPEGVQADRNTTKDEHQKESFVVFLCVAQLFEHGYLPNQLKLEGVNFSGTDKGYCDILVNDNNGDPYLIIECKTASVDKKEDEFRKHWAKTMRNGDQLFRYFNTYRKARYLCMYAADFPEYKKNGEKVNRFENIYHLISLVDNDEYLKTDTNLRGFKEMREKQGGSEEFFKVWKDTYKQDYNTRGLLEEGIAAFDIGKKNYSISDLQTIDEYSLNKKYNEFALILRKHTISSHENAFDKLVNLFLAKIIDERYNPQELHLLWKGAAYDDYFSLQDRLTNLYKRGMKEFFDDEVASVENTEIDNAFKFLTAKADEARDTIKKYFRKLKYFNNNPFAFLDVHNEQLFYKNAVILKDTISMLQDIYLTKNTDNQFLGDLFEGFLNRGVHQSEGQFFTPIPIVRFLVSSLPLRQIIEGGEIPKAIDYACGAGHFLTEYARQIKPIVEEMAHLENIHDKLAREERLTAKLREYYEQIVGIEKDYRLSKVSQVAAFMYGMDGIRIHYGDGLEEISGVQDHTYSVLVANPPYSVSGFLETLSEEDRERYTLNQYVSNIEKNNSIETFFIERAAQLLKSGGVAAIVLPSRVLSKGGLYMRTRELLLKNFDIVSICCLGPNTFGQTNTSTVVLFLRRKALEPDMSKHVENRIKEWFDGNMSDNGAYKDSENLEAYIKHMGYKRDDYIALLKNELTDSFLETAMAKEYVKALNFKKQGKNSASTALAIAAKKTRDDAQKYAKSKAYKELNPEDKALEERRYTLKFIREIEKEKLYYYMLAASNPQPVLVVQSPLNEKKKDRNEQIFLGYEWSNAKGREGIHYLNTGEMVKASADDEAADDDTITQVMGIDGIQTPLFNPLDLADALKINSLISRNFCLGKNEIPEPLVDAVHEYALTNMLNFSRVEFDKLLSTSVAYKMEFNSKYTLAPLKQYVELNPSKTELQNLSDDTKVSFVEMASVSEDGYISMKEERLYKDVKGSYTYFAENDLIIAKITPCMENGKCAIACGLTNGIGFGSSEFHVLRCKEGLLNTYLFALLNTDEVRWYAKKNMKGSSGHRRVPEEFYSALEIPLPPMDIQKKVAEECEKVDTEFQKSLTVLKKEQGKIKSLVNSLVGEKKKLSSICEINTQSITPTREPDKQYVYIDIDAVENGTGKISLNQKILGKNAPSRARRYATEGSTLISTVRPNLRGFAFVDKEVEDAVYSTGFAVLKSKDEKILANKLVYYQFMYSDALMKQMVQAMPKGSYPSINKDNIENFEMLASVKNQLEVLKQLDECEDKVKVAREYIANASSRKQAILDKYLK